MIQKELLIQRIQRLLQEVREIENLLTKIDKHVKGTNNVIILTEDEFSDIDINEIILDNLTDKYGQLPNFVYNILENIELVSYCDVISFEDWKVITFK